MASAELFKVTCVTCQAKLSVRNPALIGQIIGCPKCNSMVHIELPTIEAIAASITPVVESPPPVTQPYFEDPISDAAEAITSTPGEPLAEAPPVSVLETTTASNTKFIIGAVACFAVGAAIVGTFLVLRNSEAPESVAMVPAAVVAPVEMVAEPAIEPTPPVLSPQEEAIVQPPSENDDIEVSLVDQVETARSDTQDEATLMGPIEPPVVEAAADESPVTEEVPQESNNPLAEPKLIIENADAPRVARKFDPLALDPEQLDISAVTEAAVGADTAGPAQEKLDQQDIAAGPLAGVVRLNREQGGLSSTRLASTQLRKVLPTLSVKEMPLLEFLSLVSQVAGVPVSIAPQELQMAGISTRKTVSIDATNKTLTDALHEALAPLHLEAKPLGPQVEIIRREAAKVRSIDYPIDDLIGHGSAESFATWTEQLVEPNSWQSAGGEGKIAVSGSTLQIEQIQTVHYQILIFLERIRIAKGLPLRSKYPARLLSATPHFAAVADRMAAPTTFTFSQETPLAEVFRYWQGEMGMPVFVDWPALATVKLWPDSLITCAITNEPWQVALDKVLKPLDLAWRAAPGGAIQITSRARATTESVLDIYPAGTWDGDRATATIVEDSVNGLTYVRAPAVEHQ